MASDQRTQPGQMMPHAWQHQRPAYPTESLVYSRNVPHGGSDCQRIRQDRADKEYNAVRDRQRCEISHLEKEMIIDVAGPS
jgi:hypothetical protein